MNSYITTRRKTQEAKIQTRSMKANDKAPNPALLAAKKKAKIQQQCLLKDRSYLNDIYQYARESQAIVRHSTGIIYDERMVDHHCLWDENHQERPERFTRVISRCSELGLLDRCHQITSRFATIEEILSVHSEKHYKLLESTTKISTEIELEKFSSKFDAIFIHPTTFNLSKLAAGSTIELVESIVKGQIQNGMAIIRPPGHHAMKSEFNGYCLFNNVAIAAKYALNNLNMKRILIVDWDVHHGQGTQQIFNDDDRVLYFSIHRYEFGSFWPNLAESDFDHVGNHNGKGFNFNVPLNEIQISNGDYLAIFQQVLLPVALEYQPELIIISAGYDAAIGCPEGEMELTPALYTHFIQALSPIASSKIAVILEGGYCLDSLAESAALTLRALLGDPCPTLIDPIIPPRISIQDSILNCIYSHIPFWKCFSLYSSIYNSHELRAFEENLEVHKVTKKFIGGEPKPDIYPTRNTSPMQSLDEKEKIQERISRLIIGTDLSNNGHKLGYVYDEGMLAHENLLEKSHPEKPERISKIMSCLREFNLLDRMHQITSRKATEDELYLAHGRNHVNFIRKVTSKPEMHLKADELDSIYFHPKTFESATLASGSVLQVVDSVMRGECRSGICIVRPPGHHASKDTPTGFCIFNNVGVAAQYALQNYSLKRILIVDWDVHHGNGTQNLFESSPNVLFISLHRYDSGNFFPKSTKGNYDFIGSGRGKGFNVNIPWNKKGMGDMEYVLAFQQIILPIAYEYNPELVLVSAGFDAAAGDPLGGCKLSAEVYGYFTSWLSALANGKIILCLEGGYNVNSISYAMAMCAKTLLGDPLPPLSSYYSKNLVFNSFLETVHNVLSVQQKYWKCLQFYKKILESDANNQEDLEDKFQTLTLASVCEGAVGFTSSEEKHDIPRQCFAVVPIICPHLKTYKALDPGNHEHIITNRYCEKCYSSEENWICLHCCRAFCGRYVKGDMLEHYKETEHFITLSCSDLSIWCYVCDAYINNEELYSIKNAAHKDKFGTEIKK